MPNYLTYPMKTMRITQSYTGAFSHLPHTTGSPKDYPIDDGGKDGGKDAIYCPCDSVKVFRVYGVGSKGVNTLFLQSADKVDFADGTRDYFCALLTHPDDADLSALALGKTFRRGDVICREGSDGATGNHIHLSAGKGKVTGTGWRLNSQRKWVLTCTGGACKPEDLFFVDPAFTAIKDSKDLKFRVLPTAAGGKRVFAPGVYRVCDADILTVRTGPGLTNPKLGFAALSDDARRKVQRLAGRPVDGYCRGLCFNVTQVKNNWGKTPSGWVCLDYCERM